MSKNRENGVMMQYFEWYLPEDAVLWSKIARKAKMLASRGITSIWLPPAYKGQAGIEDVGYGVYDKYDLGEFNQKGTIPTKYGTKQEYIDCIKALQEAGIDVYADIVLNHLMGADGVENAVAVENAGTDRTQVVAPAHDIQAWTKFTFPGRGGKYSDFAWDASCFTGVDWDARKEKGGIYKFEGKEWSTGVDEENVNFDYLMGADVDFQNPKVREHLKEWGKWYLDTTGVSGFRLDAVKHIANDFFGEWLSEMRSYSKKELFTVGEYWHSDVNVLEEYLTACDRSMSLFDVPLHYNFFVASHSNGEFDMSHILDGSLVQKDPEKAVTFVGNHDTQKGQALESAVLSWFVPQAYAVILLRPQGYPCIFYGDYYGIRKFEEPGFTGELDAMMYLRRTKLFGLQHDYLDHPDVIGWTMEGDQEHPDSGIAVVMTNRNGGTKHMEVGISHAGEVWVDAFGHVDEIVTIDELGFGDFSCADGTVSIWVHEDPEALVRERLDDEEEKKAIRIENRQR